jgi:hypothetical protein
MGANRPDALAEQLALALEHGELRRAVTLAEEFRMRSGQPIGLAQAARFLPLIALSSPAEYDAYALRWLARWATETGTATIEQAAEVAASLADLPGEPTMLARLLGSG